MTSFHDLIIESLSVSGRSEFQGLVDTFEVPDFIAIFNHLVEQESGQIIAIRFRLCGTYICEKTDTANQ